MKNAKKFFALLIVFALAVTMSISAFAESSTGSITVNNTTSGKTYDIYKIFDLTYSNGTPKAVSYTVDPDWTDFFNGEGAAYIVDTDSGNLNPIAIGGETKFINITDANASQFAQDALAYAGTKAPDATAVAEGSSVLFENLALGYYLVYPQGATEHNGSICSLTSTAPDAEVNVKADYPTITKEIKEGSSANNNVGDQVTFVINGTVPDTTGFTSYTYKITDTMSAGLKFNDDVVIYADDDRLEQGVDYEVTIIDNTFTIEFANDYLTNSDNFGKAIKVEYSATITEAAVNSDATKNTAYLTYSNDPKNETSMESTPEIDVPVYSSMITVNKVDANDTSLPLAGAKFVLKNEEGKYYQAMNAADIMTEVASTAGVTDVNWVDSIDDATVLVTGEDGKIEFKGVKNGVYSLEEIAAPDGYNKLTAPVTVKVGYNENGTALLDNAVNQVEQVKNNSGTELPETGGIGTMLFVIFGGLAVVAAGIFLVTNKRMSKENF